MNRWNLFISFILILLPAFSSAETFSDSAIGFSIELPESADENWVTTLVDPFEYRYFEENTGTYNANIGVMRYTIDSSYAIPDDWCNEISYAYAVYVETHPIYGYLYIRESITHDGLYAVYVNADFGYTVVSEHVRYVGINTRGYELYVSTDTTDMINNYSHYVSIINSIKIFNDSNLTSIQIPDKFVKKLRNNSSPVISYNNMSLMIPRDIQKVEIYNPLGQIVWSHCQNAKTDNLSHINFLDLKSLRSGTYYIRYNAREQDIYGGMQTISIR